MTRSCKRCKIGNSGVIMIKNIARGAVPTKRWDYDITPVEFELLRRYDLTVPEIAPLLRMSETNVYRKIADGSIEAWTQTEGETSKKYVRGSDLRTYMVNKQRRRIPEL